MGPCQKYFSALPCAIIYLLHRINTMIKMSGCFIYIMFCSTVTVTAVQDLAKMICALLFVLSFVWILVPLIIQSLCVRMRACET